VVSIAVSKFKDTCLAARWGIDPRTVPHTAAWQQTTADPRTVIATIFSS
jgi:hypothetical protein